VPVVFATLRQILGGGMGLKLECLSCSRLSLTPVVFAINNGLAKNDLPKDDLHVYFWDSLTYNPFPARNVFLSGFRASIFYTIRTIFEDYCASGAAFAQIFAALKLVHCELIVMFRATFNISTQSGVRRFEIDALPCREAPSAVCFSFKVAGTEGGELKVVHDGRVERYVTWSEAPLAMLLRALHLLRVEWYSSVPSELTAGRVMDLDLAVLHLTQDGLTSTELASLSLKKVGYEDEYLLEQSSPNRARFPMLIDAWSSIPLGAAVKAVAQVQVEAINLHKLPVYAAPARFIDGDGAEKYLREQLPYYAVEAFDIYRKNISFDGDVPTSLVPARDWANFLAA